MRSQAETCHDHRSVQFRAAGLALSLATALVVGCTPIGSHLGVPAPVVVAAAAVAAQDAAQCLVEPREIEEFAALISSSGGKDAGAEGTPAMLPEPPEGGEPADEAVIDGVTATVEELTACLNAGDVQRMTSLMTDDFLAAFLRETVGEVDEAELKAGLAMLATPTPLPPDLHSRLEAVEDVRVLPDGRVAAVVVADGARELLVFVEMDGRYLVDDWYQQWDEATPTP